MKIAIVHEFLTKIGGAEKVLMELHKIYPDAPIYTLIYDKTGTKCIFESSDYQIIESSLKKYPSALKRKTKLFLPILAKTIEEFNFSEYDAVISSSNSFAHGAITAPATFHLCYCHSPMRYSWDWYHEYLKENRIGLGLTGIIIRNMLHNIRIWDKVSSHRVDKWIANSANVQKRIKKYYGFDSEIIFPPVDISKIKPTNSKPSDYFVIVSRLEPYKKIDLAVNCFNQNKKRLLIIGEGSQKDRLKKNAKSNIEFLGWQSDEDIYEYIRNSKALIFPGEDDFGITPVEAMACGRPVVAFGAGGCLETVQDGKTGILFSTPTTESLEEGLDKLEKNYSSFTSAACRSWSEQFSTSSFKSKIELALNNGIKEYRKELER